VNIGPSSRRGRSRTKAKAADHDFKPEATLTPFGIFLPQYDDLRLYMACSKVTSDFIVDRLEQWWEGVRLRFLRVKTPVINLDNGSENHSRRTQFLKWRRWRRRSSAWLRWRSGLWRYLDGGVRHGRNNFFQMP